MAILTTGFTVFEDILNTSTPYMHATSSNKTEIWRWVCWFKTSIPTTQLAHVLPAHLADKGLLHVL